MAGQQVVDVVVGAEIVERQQPALLGPDRNFVGADGHDVVLAALGGDVGGDALAQHVLFERDPLQLDVGVLGLVKSSVSFCMRIMSPLLTVAMVMDSACAANASALAEHKPRMSVRSFIKFLP